MKPLRCITRYLDHLNDVNDVEYYVKITFNIHLATRSVRKSDLFGRVGSLDVIYLHLSPLQTKLMFYIAACTTFFFNIPLF